MILHALRTQQVIVRLATGSKRSVVDRYGIISPCQSLVYANNQSADLRLARRPRFRVRVCITNRGSACAVVRVGVDLGWRSLPDEVVEADVVADEMDGCVAKGEVG